MGNANLKRGDRVWVSGDSDILWIEDYDAYVNTGATVWEDPVPNDKKILLLLDRIDGDTNALCYVRKNLCKYIEPKPEKKKKKRRRRKKKKESKKKGAPLVVETEHIEVWLD